MKMKMRVPYIATRHALSRRRFLLGAGVAMSLPFLDAMHPRTARAASSSPLSSTTPRRMLGICNNLGLRPDLFFPTGTGGEYVASPYLKLLDAHRNQFTVISGVSHPNVDGGHPSDISFLTAAPHPASSSFRNSISLDQLVAERVGNLTRFPSLTLAVNGGRGLSWTRTGVAIPPEGQASGVFKQLFLQGTPDEIERQIRDLDTGRSILDAVAGQAKELQKDVSAGDRNRLDQYFSSIRDLENRLQESRGWANRPRPRVTVSAPRTIRMRLDSSVGTRHGAALKTANPASRTMARPGKSDDSGRWMTWTQPHSSKASGASSRPATSAL